MTPNRKRGLGTPSYFDVHARSMTAVEHVRPTIILVVAIAKNGIIGNQGQLPWHLSDDLKRFKKLTSGGCVIMGRATYESIGKPLPNRKNIVVSRTTVSNLEVLTVTSIEIALQSASELGFDVVFGIGGERLYDALLPIADVLEVTWVEQDFVGDRSFPEVDWRGWREVDRTSAVDAMSKIPMSFVRYERADIG